MPQASILNPKLTLITEQHIVELLQKQDSQVIGVLYDKYAGALMGVVKRTIQNEALAEEVLQDTFTKIWRYSTNYDASKGKLFTWMLNIARNTAIDATRAKNFSQKNQFIDDIVNTVESQNHVNAINSDGLDLKELSNKLTPELFAVVDIIYFKGYTHVEAAEELLLPLGTVKTRLRIALKQLRNYF